MAVNLAGLQAQVTETVARINAAVAVLQSGTADQAAVDAAQAQLKEATDALAAATTPVV